MIEKIKKILLEQKELSGWKIIQKNCKSNELFFVKKELHMNRAKDVTHFIVTVYKDFEEGESKFKGSSTAKLHPTMKEEEIKVALEDAIFASNFVKNEYYPLAAPSSTSSLANLESSFASKSLSEWMPMLTEAIYSADLYENGGINSSEFFLNDVSTRIITSEGIDVFFKGYEGEIEFITNWKESSEEIELYKCLHFADLDKNLLKEEVETLLTHSKEKAIATPTPSLEKHTVLLTGEPVKEFLNYYYTQASSQAVYEGMSTAKLNENIQGSSVKGDRITLKLDPALPNSTGSEPYDEDGFPLEEVKVFEEGILKKHWGNVRFSHYLDVAPTGNIKNIVVEGGKKSIAELKADPYLELVAFSDFQLDSLTGDFAGEIRLGWHYDGSSVKPVTGGSISGNIKEVHGEMYLSKEIQNDNSFVGPKTVQLFNVSVSGI